VAPLDKTRERAIFRNEMIDNRIFYTIQSLLRCTGMDPKSIDSIAEAARTYALGLDREVQFRGKASAVVLYKQLHVISKCIAVEQPFAPLPFRKSNKEGIPKVLMPLVPFLRGSPEDKRAALTVTRFFESITLAPSLNLEPITEQGPEVPSGFIEDFKDFLKTWVPRVLGKVSLPSRNKVGGRLVNGPNGSAILTSHYDAAAVCSDKTLLHHMVQYGTLSGNKWIVQ
jgi:hypothetical protein